MVKSLKTLFVWSLVFVFGQVCPVARAGGPASAGIPANFLLADEDDRFALKLALTYIVEDYNRLRTTEEFVNVFYTLRSPDERRRVLRKIKGHEDEALPKIRRDGTVLVFGEGRDEIRVDCKHFKENRYLINGQSWAFNPARDISGEVDAMARKLELLSKGAADHSALLLWLLPEADASAKKKLAQSGGRAVRNAAEKAQEARLQRELAAAQSKAREAEKKAAKAEKRAKKAEKASEKKPGARSEFWRNIWMGTVVIGGVGTVKDYYGVSVLESVDDWACPKLIKYVLDETTTRCIAFKERMAKREKLASTANTTAVTSGTDEKQARELAELFEAGTAECRKDPGQSEPPFALTFKDKKSGVVTRGTLKFKPTGEPEVGYLYSLDDPPKQLAKYVFDPDTKRFVKAIVQKTEQEIAEEKGERLPTTEKELSALSSNADKAAFEHHNKIVQFLNRENNFCAQKAAEKAEKEVKREERATQ